MLFDPESYTNWQLACTLAVQQFREKDLPEAEIKALRMKEEEWAELVRRGKTDAEIDEMRLFARRVANWMKPIDCMAEDDLELGLKMASSKGLITPQERMRMYDTMQRLA